ncbi:DUF2510 domain-containing protein [Desertihabitans brevis]|uniref:DUF2510 domain-containing protein n=1 Tax=Desertihabitans brevis TaxID=2268447 RepID=A0A367YRB3_9ACTN|nr:DUF2510 domain-containing protein [Desertihabitans brevis]RCK68433.1 DUF2510 domain-containing protein [Desertihabitans brevis]
MATAPGWYRDPADSTTYRWWNGLGWTAWRAETDQSPPPPHGGDARTVATVVPAGDRQQRHTARTVLVAVVVLVGLLAAVGVMGAIRRAAEPVPGATTAPTVFGTPAVQAPDLELDAASRRVVLLGELEAQLPADPAVAPRETLLELADPAVLSETEIDGTGFFVHALVGYAGPTLEEQDLDATAAAAGAWVLDQLFSDTDLYTPGTPTTGPLGDLPADRAVQWQVEVAIDSTELDAEADLVRVGVVELSDGRQVVLLSTFPDRADPELAAAFEAYWDSISLR